MTKTDQIVYSSFFEHALQLPCHMVNCCRKLIVLVFSSGVTSKSLSPVFGAQMSMVHVVHKYIAKVSNPLY